MNEDKKQDISESQEAYESPSHYLEDIMADARRLSGIIDVIATLSGEKASYHGVDFDNLSFAMHDFSYKISDLAEELCQRLGDIGILHTKLPQPTITRQDKEGGA